MADEKYIVSRINRSKETLEEARIMFQNEHYLTVINRLYYAIFYLVCAFLESKNIVTKSHSGTKNQFHLHFVKTGIVKDTFADLYNDLFHERNDSDYGDFQTLSKEDAKTLLIETEEQLKKYWKEFEKLIK